MDKAADTYISTKTERGGAHARGTPPRLGESRENLRRFMEEGTLELSFKGPIGIWQVKRVGNGKTSQCSMQGYKGREYRWENTGKVVLISGVQCSCVNLIS